MITGYEQDLDRTDEFHRERFEQPLEEAFRAWYQALSFQRTRIGLVAGLCGVALTAGMDALFLPEALRSTIVPIRTLVLSATLGLMFVAVSQAAWARLHDGIMVVGIVLCGWVSLACGTFLTTSAQTFAAQQSSMLVLILYAYLFLGLRFAHAALAGAAISASFLAALLWLAAPLQVLAYTGLNVAAMNLIGALCAYAVEGAARSYFRSTRALAEDASHDALTGLHNRRAFNTIVDRIWREAQRSRQALAIMMLDVDYFKQFNDTYGHQAGDDCLQRIGEVLGRVAQRPLDLAARYGGEEFVLVLSGADYRHVRATAERLCSAVAQLGIEHRRSRIARVVTASVGATVVMPGADTDTPRAAVQYADRALYDAKAQGRNRAAFFFPPVADEPELRRAAQR